MNRMHQLASVAALQWVLRRANICIIVFFALAYVVTQIFRHQYGMMLGGTYGLVQLFDVRVEQNLPTAYSTLLLLVASAVLFLIAQTYRSNGDAVYRKWGILALLFLFLAIDEAAVLHERWSFVIWHFKDTTGVLHDAWVIVYSVLLIGFAAYFLPFVRALPSPTRIRFIIAGVVFVGAALGMELVQGFYESNYGSWKDARYAILAGIEEIMEMGAIAYFIDAALRHLNVHLDVHSIQASAAN